MTLLVRQDGFTLFELLVVLTIAAVIFSGVALVVSGDSSAKRINRQGDILFAQMNFAMDEALVLNHGLGIVLEPDPQSDESRRYSWRRVDGINEETGKVIWASTEAPLGRHKLDEFLSWSFDVEGLSAEETLDQLLQDDSEPRPIVVFYPSGEITAFNVEITLSADALDRNPEAVDERYKITLDKRGRLTRYVVGESELEN